LRKAWHPERMSLTTDGLALGAAFAIAVGSAVQARQAYTELNEKTPARNSLTPLLVAAIGAWFRVAVLFTSGTYNLVALNVLVSAGLFTSPLTELTPEQVAALPPGQAAVLAAGKATALTDDQAAARAEGRSIRLTDGQVAAMNAERVKDIKRWLGLLVGWLFILIGAVIALVGAALMLAYDL